jgi:hypothetical protein
VSNPFPIKRAWRIESRRKELGYATRCPYCPETDISCFEIEHPVTKKLDPYFTRAVCRNCHRKLEFRRDVKGLTKNGIHDPDETELDKLKRYLLLMAEDLASFREEAQECPELSRETILADYRSREASLRRIANAPPDSCPGLPHNSQEEAWCCSAAVPLQTDAGDPSSETRRTAKRS